MILGPHPICPLNFFLDAIFFDMLAVLVIRWLMVWPKLVPLAPLLSSMYKFCLFF